MRDRHPVVPLILRFRALSKLKTAYLDSLLALARRSSTSGIVSIHGEWNHLTVETGRLSCSKPALQCIPRDPEPLSTAASTAAAASSFAPSFNPGRPGAAAGPGGGVGGSGEAIHVRDAFVPLPGHVLLAADYSQIEVRVLAHYCEDQGLLDIFRAPGAADIYATVASTLLKKPVQEVTPSERSLAKTACLGIIYGMGHREVCRPLTCWHTVGLADEQTDQ